MPQRSGLSWRDVITWFAIPGLLLAPLLTLTVEDPGRSSAGSRTARRRTRAKVGRLKRKAQEAIVELMAETKMSKERLRALSGRIKEARRQADVHTSRRRAGSARRCGRVPPGCLCSGIPSLASEITHESGVTCLTPCVGVLFHASGFVRHQVIARCKHRIYEGTVAMGCAQSHGIQRG